MVSKPSMSSAEAKNLAKKMPPEFLVCRVRNVHQLQGYVVEYGINNKHGIKVLVETEVCQTCGTQRVQDLHPRTGLVIARRYVHPKGYLLTDEGFIDAAARGMLRLERARRVREDNKVQARLRAV